MPRYVDSGYFEPGYIEPDYDAGATSERTLVVAYQPRFVRLYKEPPPKSRRLGVYNSRRRIVVRRPSIRRISVGYETRIAAVSPIPPVGEGMEASFIKEPDAFLDYGFDWSQWLEDGEAVVVSTWVVPEGLTVEAEEFTGTITTVWLSGGTVGANYRLVNHIETATRTDERSMQIRVRER
jgi:hypothetical protein